jgi:hypothetical protein
MKVYVRCSDINVGCAFHARTRSILCVQVFGHLFPLFSLSCVSHTHILGSIPRVVLIRQDFVPPGYILGN